MSVRLPDALAGLVRVVEAVDRGELRAEHFGRVPPAGGGRAAAVLLLFVRELEGLDVLLIERAATMRNHAGQIAFPGGACDVDDADAVATALREAHEETGLDSAGVDVIGTLPALYVAPSGFVVTPVVAWWPAATGMSTVSGASVPSGMSTLSAVDSREVAAVHRVSVTDLVDPAHRVRVSHSNGYEGPAFRVPTLGEPLLIWGFTALVLDSVIRLAGWDAWESP